MQENKNRKTVHTTVILIKNDTLLIGKEQIWLWINELYNWHKLSLYNFLNLWMFS